MKQFYYIFIFFSILLYSSNIYSICKIYYTKNNASVYPENFSHLNYTNTNAKQGGTLKLITDISFNTTNPFDITKQLPPYYLLLAYESLFIAPLDDINTLHPLIAKNFCIFKNTITINLHNKSFWNDGTPILAKDITFALNNIKNTYHPFYTSLAKNIKSINIINNVSVSVEFYQLSDDLIYSLFTLPLRNFKGATSGPYIIKKINFGQELVLQKNHKYWATNLPIRKYQFNFDTIIIKTQHHSYSILDAFSNKNVNYYTQDNFNHLKLFNEQFLKKNYLKILSTQKNSIPRFYGLFFNLSKNTLQDINIRTAILLAYDFSYVNKKFFNKSYKRFNSLFINSKFYNDNNINNHKNLKLASKYLDASDFIFVNNIRIHKTQHTQLILNIIFSNEETLLTSLHWIKNLQILGIKVNYTILPSYSIYNYISNNNYDVIEQSYLFSNPPQEELLSYFSNHTQFNYTKLQNSYINQLINNKKFKKLDETLFAMKIFLPLYYNPLQYYIMQKNLQPMYTQFGIDLMSSYFE